MSRTAHLIGVCGAGMSAVARLLQQEGYAISGSDEGAYPPVSLYLEKIGVTPQIGHRPQNIPADPDLIIIGKHAKLIPDENTEVRAALTEHRAIVRSFPEVLADLTVARRRMVVAGSYGKSTMAALITHCLIQAGAAPGWFIGAIPNGFEHSSDIGGDGPFIFEGDEYPSANWDPRSKFEHYQPHSVLLTAATHDHVNVFPTIADYHAPFEALLRGVEARSGRLIACVDEENAAAFFDRFGGEKVSYGLAPTAEVHALRVSLGQPEKKRPTRFDLSFRGIVYTDFQIRELGPHAVQNACGAAAYLLSEKLVDPDALRDALLSFSGVKRRLERKIEGSPMIVYEGFGSSFEKARAAIEAMRVHYPRRRIVVMFEPHAFTWRNRASLAQYDHAFDGVDDVWVFAPPSHGAASHAQASLDEIVARAAKRHSSVRAFQRDEFGRLAETLSAETDVLLVLSSGSFDGALAPFLEMLLARHPRGGETPSLF